MEKAETEGCPKHTPAIERVVLELEHLRWRIEEERAESLLSAALESICRWIRLVIYERVSMWPCQECPTPAKGDEESQLGRATDPMPENSENTVESDQRLEWITTQKGKMTRTTSLALREAALAALREFRASSPEAIVALQGFTPSLSELSADTLCPELGAWLQQKIDGLISLVDTEGFPTQLEACEREIRTLSP
jgi:hypothetical protein